jgi:hypothetical protein
MPNAMNKPLNATKVANNVISNINKQKEVAIKNATKVVSADISVAKKNSNNSPAVNKNLTNLKNVTTRVIKHRVTNAANKVKKVLKPAIVRAVREANNGRIGPLGELQQMLYSLGGVFGSAAALPVKLARRALAAVSGSRMPTNANRGLLNYTGATLRHGGSAATKTIALPFNVLFSRRNGAKKRTVSRRR